MKARFLKCIFDIFGEYNFDKAGISQKNIVVNSYVSSWEEREEGSGKQGKLTSESKVLNFLYNLYNL